MPELKKWNIVVIAAIFAVFSFGSRIVQLITDYYWFNEIGFNVLFQKSFLTQIALFLVVTSLSWALLALNLRFAKKISRKPFVIIGPDASITAPFPTPQLADLRNLLQPILFAGTFVAAFLLGSWAWNQWDIVLKFLNGVSFQLQDPLFSRDISFYVFKVPFYKFLYHFLLAATLLSLAMSVITYLLNNRVYLSNRGIQMAEDSKNHIVLLLGFLFLLIGAHFQINIWDLLSSQRNLAPGAGFTNVHATLPILKILRIAAVLGAIAAWVSPYFPNRKIILITTLSLAGGALLGRLYGDAIQKFEVGPNEISKETPYLQLAIQYTRQAYGLTDIQELEFDPQENLTPSLLKKNELTLNNIRLWEHKPLLTSYGQLQEIRTYYDFLDADNDRYRIDGQYRQVMLSVRELLAESLPSRIWINEHLTYTHGYGICMGPVNRISPEGLPEFFIKDIPPSSSIPLKVTQPEIYFGEARSGYSIVKTKSKEFDYPAGDQNVYTEYKGSGGVPIKNFLRKILFALRFREIKILFTGNITSDSRILYHRSIKERLSKAAPFLHFDNDPYIVVADDGKLFWIVDGYTATDRYPYSEKIGNMNYIKNSVKATVDAYEGSIRLYISDPADPIVQTYARIFPQILHSMEEMPNDLKSHIRYPQTLMNIQAKIYATYHMNDPQVFYNKEDLWKIPIRTAGGRSEAMEPYYTIMNLAGVGTQEEFILMVPFTPAKKENMIAWLAARCDEPNYGKLLVYNFPKQKLVYGPQQIESRIDQDAEISKQLTLWDQGGSRVLRGSLLVIPVEQSLLYVQPLYLEASSGGLPELKRVILAYGNSIAMEENFESSLSRIFGGRPSPSAESVAPSSQKSGKEEGENFKSLLQRARDYLDRAQKAARGGDWSNYGEEMKRLENVLKSQR